MKPTAAHRRHFERLAQMPCLACGRYGVHIHHVVSDGFKRLSKRHDRTIPLCPECHQHGPEAVHKIGHGPFNELHEFDQLAEAERLWNA